MDVAVTSVEILTKMYPLLSREANWTVGELARDVAGVACDPMSADAVAWSCPGAAMKFGGPGGWDQVKGHILAFAPGLGKPVGHREMCLRLQGGLMHAQMVQWLGPLEKVKPSPPKALRWGKR